MKITKTIPILKAWLMLLIGVAVLSGPAVPVLAASIDVNVNARLWQDDSGTTGDEEGGEEKKKTENEEPDC